MLLGIVTIDDVLWVTNEEFSEDIQKIGGAEALDMPYLETPIFTLVRKRVGWLIILFLSEMFTATAMAFYNDELSKMIVLTNFIPLIMSSGGNSGSQASTLIIQAMALGEVTLADWWRVMRREILSGLLLGVILGIIGFCRIFIWSLLMHHGLMTDIYGLHKHCLFTGRGCTLGFAHGKYVANTAEKIRGRPRLFICTFRSYTCRCYRPGHLL